MVGGETMVASTLDLSASGVGLVVDRAIMKDRMVTLVLFLTQDGIEDPDEEPFESKAKVMWLKKRDDGKFAVGVELSALAPAQKTRLERFLAAIK
jgi:c-di-GMP-binding flagellar brake protein YcgR